MNDETRNAMQSINQKIDHHRRRLRRAYKRKELDAAQTIADRIAEHHVELERLLRNGRI